MTAPPLRAPVLLPVAAAAVCLGFAGFTGHVWEDYFTAFRSSLNLATGHGFVFQPGERVHTFSSPLGALLPALFAIGDGDDVAVRALWLFRLVSAVAFGTAIWLGGRSMIRAGVTAPAFGAAALAWILDPKTVDFSINGMESALMVLFVVLTWCAFTEGARILPCALGLAGLQWTRPDGCVFFAAIAVSWFFLGAQTGEMPPGTRLWRIARAVFAGTLFFLPWVVFAWSYYGSPVPHTVLAKISDHGAGELSRALFLYPWRLLFGHVALHSVFMPAYFFFGGWPECLGWIARLVSVIAALAWLVPGLRPGGRIASLAFFLGGFYVEYIPRSPWYYPGWQALAFVTMAYVLDFAQSAKFRWEAVRSFARIGAVSLIAVQGLLLGCVAWQMRSQQAVIENGQRRQIGLWLRSQAAPGDRVYLEPLGYIGFFSGLKMLDYPGLSSPEVVAARQSGNRTYAQLIANLTPEWLVLRPDQMETIRRESPRLLGGDYRLARTFDVRAAVDALPALPGRPYLEFDALYFVYQRTATTRDAR